MCIDEAQVVSQVVLNWHLLTDLGSAAWLGEFQSWVWCQHMGMVNSSHETQVDLKENKTIPDGGVAPHHFLRLDCITRKDLKEV